MARPITRRLHWPHHDHEQKLQTWTDPAEPPKPEPPPKAQTSPPWILPPVLKAKPPEARP